MTSAVLLILRSLSLLVTVFAVAGVFFVPNPLVAAPMPPPAGVRSLPHTDVNPLAANVFLDREVEPWKKQETLRLVKEAGIGWIKQMFRWEEIEPARGIYWSDRSRTSTWEKYDEIVRMARSLDLDIIARLDRPPAWARGGPTKANGPPVRFEDFGEFVFQVVRRYRGQVRYYQIWNEPNLTGEWNGGAVDPAAYARLLTIAYRRAKEADPTAVVLSAPLAQTLETGPLNVNEVDFLRKMYAAGVRGSFDVLGANAYGFDRPPDDPPDPAILNFQRVTMLRKLMVEQADGDKPIWLNEVGWNAPPPDFPSQRLIWRRVSEEQQAEYTARGIELARSWPWAGVVGIWYFRQVGDIPTTDAAYYFRMVDVEFTPRPVYAAVRALADRHRVAAPGRFEETNPALLAAGSWRRVADERASGGTWLQAGGPADEIRITFEGSALALEMPAPPRSGVLSVGVDGAAPRRVPVSGEAGRRLEVWVAGDLTVGRHTAVIRALDPAVAGAQLLVDGFVVRADAPSYRRFYVAIALAAAGALGLAATLLARPRAT
ncbi:MAG: hypothetical protein HY331_06690 [Chloroflexi bacterium]|nr:hypothetical protein [Chloroflexota bacterium]